MLKRKDENSPSKITSFLPILSDRKPKNGRIGISTQPVREKRKVARASSKPNSCLKNTRIYEFFTVSDMK
ncbi:MAG: hypothetical protein QW323_03805, partial [Candidatus Bathyarchaeia archaeon]